jgi:predicted Zn-dependent peptidase
MVTITEKRTFNGLPVILAGNPSLNGVAVTLFVRVGSAFETGKNNGISHLLEHLIFRNSTQEEADKYFPLNLDLEAWTRKDFTCYEISCHKNDIEQIFGVLSFILGRNNFSSEEIQREKEIIAQEINEKEEEPFTLLEQGMDKFLYKDSSWGLEVLGTARGIDSIDSKQLKNWYDKYYVPANMILTISGNFDTKKTFKLINDYNFGSRKEKANKEYSLPFFEYNRYVKNFSANKNFDQTYLSLAFPAPIKLGEEEYFRYLLLAEVLNKKLKLSRKNEADLYDLDLYFYHYLSTGEIRLDTSIEKKKAEQMLKKLVQQLLELNISQNFFEKIQSVLKKNFYCGPTILRI